MALVHELHSTSTHALHENGNGSMTCTSSHDPIAMPSGADCDHRRNAEGFTLPEVLVTVLLSGMLIAVLTTALMVMMRSTPEAEARLAESKDVTFLSAWLPVDLSTATGSWRDPDDAAVKSAMSAGGVTYNATLSGTNVLTLTVPSGSGVEVVSYRYEQEADGTWRIARYRISDPGQASESVSLVGVAYELPDPPDDWSPGEVPTHAVEVISRNQAATLPVGEDVTVKFESGNEFMTGGASLSAEEDLLPQDPVTLPDPTAPPTRCGGRIALVLDTSWSVPDYSGGGDLEAAATGLIDAFTGTPSELTVFGFDALAYSLYPNLNGDPATYFSLLDDTVDSNTNGTTDHEEAKANIRALPDVDKNDGGSSYWSYQGTGYTGTGSRNNIVGWTQNRYSESGTLITGGGTNWEDALHAPFYTEAGALRGDLPETVIWITDGDPNQTRSGLLSYGYSGNVVSVAQQAANAGRATGARIIGVLVGNPTSTLENNLASVVGNNKWNGTGPDDLGNAVAADYFTGSFDQLGTVLRSIAAAECGGTITVRKQLDDGTVPSGQWNYSSPTGDQVLDTTAQSSITFDFNFETGTIEQTVRITEEVQSGYAFLRADCSSAGTALDPSRVVQQPDGVAGVEVTVGPDEAVSCIMVSELTP